MKLQSALATQSKQTKVMILNMSFLVKFEKSSFVHCQWISGLDIVANYNKSSIQTFLEFI